MKISFPNGEHAAVLLSPGATRVGGGMEADITLAGHGLAEVVAVIRLTPQGALLVPEAGPVTVNHAEARELIALRDGDRLGFGPVVARIVALPSAQAAAPSAERAPVMDEATRLMSAMPRLFLRGINGDVFARRFPVSAKTVIGRGEDCDIRLDLPEVSRRHARLRPALDGVAVEDLQSSNGTFVNGDRIAHSMLRVGDELRIDSVRFVLQSHGAIDTVLVEAPASRAAGGRRRAGAATAGVLGLALLLLATVAALR